jgi:hypothetical protein
MRILRAISAVFFCAAVFITGFTIGMCVKVFMERGVPVINGGGELIMLLAIPAAIYIGFRLGSRRKQNTKIMEE